MINTHGVIRLNDSSVTFAIIGWTGRCNKARAAGSVSMPVRATDGQGQPIADSLNQIVSGMCHAASASVFLVNRACGAGMREFDDQGSSEDARSKRGLSWMWRSSNRSMSAQRTRNEPR